MNEYRAHAKHNAKSTAVFNHSNGKTNGLIHAWKILVEDQTYECQQLMYNSNISKIKQLISLKNFIQQTIIFQI